MGKVTFRHGEVKDIPEIVQMSKELSAHQNYSINSPDAQKLLEDGFGTGGPCRAIVAEATHENGDTELVGMVTYALSYYLSVGRFANMSGFYIKPDYRSQGLGTQLYKQVLKEVFEDHGCTTLSLYTGNANEVSKAFYKKLGAVDVYGDLEFFPLWHFSGKPIEKLDKTDSGNP